MVHEDDGIYETTAWPQEVTEGRKGHLLDAVVSIPNLPAPAGAAPGAPSVPAPSAPPPDASASAASNE